MIGVIRVGLIGTGYAARLRADCFQQDPRSRLQIVASRNAESAWAMAEPHRAEITTRWQDLVESPEVDLIVIATTNDRHGDMAQAAVQAGKAVVVEYPLALDLDQATAIVTQAEQQGTFLHVEHIELLGGLHQALRQHLSDIGTPFHVHYRTVNPQHPAPHKWSYQPEAFGFPLMGALSRIHRMTDAFGPVDRVFGQCRYQFAADAEAANGSDPAATPPARFTSCMCTAQLQFQSGLVAEVIYGKGEALWQGARYLEVQGDRGALVFDRDHGILLNESGERSLTVAGRRGLFAKDTAMVLDALENGAPLYVQPRQSLYALTVADAVRRSAASQTAIELSA